MENVKDKPAKRAEQTAETVKPEAMTAAPEEGSPEWYEEKVQYKAFKDTDKYKDDIFVAVNGKGYQIQRGVVVEIARYVLMVLEQSQDQDARAANMMDDKADEFAAESRARGI